MSAPVKVDRKLSADVRRVSLKKILKILTREDLDEEEKAFHNALLLKMAGSLLPRLNEVTGAEGRELVGNTYNNLILNVELQKKIEVVESEIKKQLLSEIK